MKRFFTRSLVNSRQAELIQVMGVAITIRHLATMRLCVEARQGARAKVRPRARLDLR